MADNVEGKAACRAQERRTEGQNQEHSKEEDSRNR